MLSYTNDFYEEQRDGSRRSAEQIVPLVLELIRPRRVVDVGCGVGTWLSVVSEQGVTDVLGIDGDYINRQLLMIPERQFRPANLAQPLQVNEQFDLVLSLEVAEHLPSECAALFVESLTQLGPIVLFSAAVPFQGGTHHINEQWPDYWAEHFRARGYVAIDYIRKRVWQNQAVSVEYAQNTLLFARRDYVAGHAVLEREFAATNQQQLSIIHPRAYLVRAEPNPARCSLSRVMMALPDLALRALQRRLAKKLARVAPRAKLPLREPKRFRIAGMYYP